MIEMDIELCDHLHGVDYAASFAAGARAAVAWSIDALPPKVSSNKFFQICPVFVVAWRAVLG